MEQPIEKKMRLDKWLKIARIFKTRSKASESCEQGRVRVNDQIAKAAKTIKVGDVISVKLDLKTRTLDVLALSNKSMAAADARLLYHEHEPTIEEKNAEEMRALFFKSSKSLKPKYKGRPTKREGRSFRKTRGH